MDERRKDTVEYEMVERIGVLTQYHTGWAKEINIVEWNKGPAKYDLRDWNPEHTRMSRGVTLYEDEAKKLAEALEDHFLRRRLEAAKNNNYEPIGGGVEISVDGAADDADDATGGEVAGDTEINVGNAACDPEERDDVLFSYDDDEVKEATA